MVDKDLKDRLDQLEAICRQNGWNLWEALDNGGLLLTPGRRLLVEETVLAVLLQRLDSQQHVTLAQLGGGQTVSGAVRGCVNFIDAFREDLGAKGKGQ